MKLSKFITYTHDKLDEVEEGYPELEVGHKVLIATLMLSGAT